MPPKNLWLEKKYVLTLPAKIGKEVKQKVKNNFPRDGLQGWHRYFGKFSSQLAVMDFET
jgi:hypothetical protein